MAAPPLEPGAVKLMDACVSPALALTPVGAPGTVALTVNDWVTVGAVLNVLLPAWFASMVQVPPETKLSRPPEVMVQTPVVLELNVGAKPEVAVALSVGVLP